MACRDPWVLYTICTSLIRYTLKGLYEDKLPRDIPEVGLLVQFLMFGLSYDLSPPALSAVSTKDRSSGSKRSSSPGLEEDTVYPKCPQKALVGYILPAVAQLQVLTWRAQLAEEILATSHHLWPGYNVGQIIGVPCPGGTTSGASDPGPGSTPRRSSVSGTLDSRESTQPPSAMQKQISDAAQSTSVTLPADYLAHPIGYLILQYHALFALERNELTVLRVLLKTAASAVQHHSRASRSTSKSTPNKTACASPPPSSITTSASSSIPTQASSPIPTASSAVCFRWRPEVLQALVLGISRLPSSCSAFVDANRPGHHAAGPDSSTLGDNGPQIDVGANTTGGSVTEHNSATGSTTSEHSAGTMPGGSGKAVSTTGHSGPLFDNRIATSMPMISRAELAMLLRASLTLVNDLNLLALAQIALLVPGPQPGTPTSGTSGTGVPSTGSSFPAASTPLTPDAPNPTSVSMIGGTLSSGAKIGLYGGYGQQTPFLSVSGTSGSCRIGPFHMPNQPDAWSGATPRSPTSSRFSRSLSTGSTNGGGTSYVSASRLESRGPGSSSSSAYYQSQGLNAPLPMGTPLTNPGQVGLGGATPSLSSLVGMIPPTPRRPSTPPREFLPSSPAVATTTSGLNSFNLPSHLSAYGTEFQSSCPSPSIHRSNNGGLRNTRSYSTAARPHSPNQDT
ncbi:unnamed protein product [Echinostoma caproni]|uniref:Uncharacterized protein n=1 Tax=Echinostoma caproni TaxID=27848 RepID=A0A183AJ06_9TREM|nr:unnamed protein product [Echinostoma caproni]